MVDTSERSVAEAISKTVALHIGVMIAYGHLQSLQGRRVEISSVIRVCLLPFLPVLPMVELLLSALRTVIRYRKKGVGAWHLHMLDVGISDNSSTATTNTTRDTRLNSREGNGRAHCATLGRVIAILVCLIQSALTMLLYIRRDHFGKDIYPFEHKNFHITAAGVLSCFLSIPIQFFRNSRVEQHRIREIILRIFLSVVVQPFSMFIFCRTHALEPFRVVFTEYSAYIALAYCCFVPLLIIVDETGSSNVTWKFMLEAVIYGSALAIILVAFTMNVVIVCVYPLILVAVNSGVKRGHGWAYWWLVADGAWGNNIQFETWKWKDPIAEVLWIF